VGTAIGGRLRRWIDIPQRRSNPPGTPVNPLLMLPLLRNSQAGDSGSNPTISESASLRNKRQL